MCVSDGLHNSSQLKASERFCTTGPTFWWKWHVRMICYEFQTLKKDYYPMPVEEVWEADFLVVIVVEEVLHYTNMLSVVWIFL